MRPSSHKRIWLSFTYLGLLFGLGGWLYARLLFFEGEVFLPRGAAERLAVAPHDPARTRWAGQRNVSADLLAFDNPRAAARLGRDGRFDAAFMPLGLRLEDLEIIHARPDTHHLHLIGPGGTEEVPIAPGAAVPLDGGEARVEHIGPWEGLIRHARGPAMAHVAAGDLGGALFLESGSWNFPDGEIAVHFKWHESEDRARQARAASRDDIAGEARWGVQDGQAIQWIHGLTPGNALALRDGTRVMSLGTDPGRGELRVRVDDGGGARDVLIAANDFEGGGPIYYQDPASAPWIFMLHAWEDDRVLVQRFGTGGGPEERVLASGESWPGGGEPPFRLEQVYSRAVPVTRSAGQLSAARLAWGDRVETLPEGHVKTLGGVRLEYIRRPQPPEALLHLAAVDDTGVERAAITLRPGGSARIGAWVIRARDGAQFSPEGVVLAASRRPGGWAFYGGLFLAAAGSFGLTYIRFTSPAGRAGTSG